MGKEALDFPPRCSCRRATHRAGHLLPFHLGAMPFAVRRDQRLPTAHPAAIFSSPTIPTMAAPICRTACGQAGVLRGPVVGFSGAGAHDRHGGRMPAQRQRFTEIYQEGLRIPPSRLWREGDRMRHVRLIERNVRYRRRCSATFDRWSRLHRWRREMQSLVERYGAQAFERHCRDLLDYTGASPRRDCAAAQGHLALRRSPRRRWRWPIHPIVATVTSAPTT